MTNFISNLHTDLQRALLSGRGVATSERLQPVKGLYKSYERMEKIPLPEVTPIATSISEVMMTRQSFDHGQEEGVISLADWGTLLGTALGVRKETDFRHYPSGGSMYPIETYVVTSALPGRPLSLSHYVSSQHTLEYLWALPLGLEIRALTMVPAEILYSTIIIFTSVWKRSSGKYGDFAYNLALLEAGHMAQNVLLTASALGLQARPIMGFSDEPLTELLDLDSEEERIVYAVILSR